LSLDEPQKEYLDWVERKKYLQQITVTEKKWEKIIGFGRRSHILTEGKTLCGKDVSISITHIQRNPQKRCNRCFTISALFDRIDDLKLIE